MIDLLRVPRWGRRLESPLIIAHRGASAHELENTIAAFRRARVDHADGVELDVQLCATGEVVVFHDNRLDRLANRPDLISDLSLKALREIPLRGGGFVPTLSDVLEELGPRMLVNVELKVPRLSSGGALVSEVVKVLRKHSLGVRALVSSFHPLALARFRLAAPEITSGLLFSAVQSIPMRAAWSRHLIMPFALHPEHWLADGEQIRYWHGQGYAVNAWTVDDRSEVRRLCVLGVDGLITNHPLQTRSYLP